MVQYASGQSRVSVKHPAPCLRKFDSSLHHHMPHRIDDMQCRCNSCAGRHLSFTDSSVVEHAAVNGGVEGSNPSL